MTGIRLMFKNQLLVPFYLQIQVKNENSFTLPTKL